VGYEGSLPYEVRPLQDAATAHRDLEGREAAGNLLLKI
jgi:hypothetical protein